MGMRTFNYSAIKEQKWDSGILSLIAAIYKEVGKQELYLKQRPEELEMLVEIAKVQSTEEPDEQEIAGYRDVLNLIHENFDAILLRRIIFCSFTRFYTAIEQSMAGRTKSVQNYRRGAAEIGSVWGAEAGGCREENLLLPVEVKALKQWPVYRLYSPLCKKPHQSL